MKKSDSRIRSVYAERDKQGKGALYSWDKPDAIYQNLIKYRMFSKVLNETFGNDIRKVQVLDVGCGSGGFLRTLVEWGANPKNLVGTEILENRLEKGREISPTGIRFRVADLTLNEETFDLVSAHTVFSSILSNFERQKFAEAIWDKVRNGGWIMIFDFRYNNPSNPNVRKVTRKELSAFFPSKDTVFFLDMLAPPLSRRLARNNYFLLELLNFIFPFLRSHFVFMAKKN